MSSEFDARLKAAFALDAPPARDWAFQAEVLEKVARARFRRSVFGLVPFLIAAVAALWTLSPILIPLLEGLGQSLAPAAAILTLAAITGLVSVQILRPRGTR